MNIKQLALNHLKDSFVMQLATSKDGQPWICNVHFLAEEDLTLYWMSEQDSRHSEDIAANPKVAAAIAVHTEMPLIGVQLEGDAKLLDFAGNEKILQAYASRHHRETLVADALAGRVPFKLYELTPRLVQIFDLKNFPKSPIQSWRP